MSGFYLLPTFFLVSIHSLWAAQPFVPSGGDLSLHMEACDSAELRRAHSNLRTTLWYRSCYSQEIVAQKTLKFGKLISRRIFKRLNFNVDYSVPCFTLSTRGHYHNWMMSTKGEKNNFTIPYFITWRAMWDIINFKVHHYLICYWEEKKIWSIKLCHLNSVDCHFYCNYRYSKI